MDQRRVGSGGVLAVLAVLLTALLGGCGSPSENRSAATGADLSSATVVHLNSCTGCHTNITAQWLTSRHANLADPSVLSSLGTPTIGQIQNSGCSTQYCHDPYGDSNYLTAGYTGALGIQRPVVGCEACHGPGSLHASAGGAGPISLESNTTAGSISWGTSTIQVSGQFLTCTYCHELLNSSGTVTTAAHDTGGSDAAASGVSGPRYSITDTHFATGMIYGTNGVALNSPITGYAMDYTSQTVCTDCHNPHGTADINRDWAASAHGDRAVTESNLYNAWNHYNWSCDGTDALICGPTSTSGPGFINNQRYCQRCHTTTGYANYLDALRAGNIKLANNLHAGILTSVTISYAPDWKPEMLECRGCHINNRGDLRNPGAYTAVCDYRVTAVGAVSGTPPTIWASAQIQYPNLSSSNVCIPCHSGRTVGQSVKNLNSTPTLTVDFSNLKPTDSHHYAAAATMFRTHGYEYPTRDYDNPAGYLHDKIGTSAASKTGTGGPCVGCHMYRTGMTADHLFSPVSTSSTGTILNVSSDAVCYVCHTMSSGDLADMAETERAAFKDALSAFLAELPFTSSTTNWLSPGDADKLGNITGKNNLGAYFNYRSLNAEPGAFIHNGTYAKRLIYDSIDWLDDGMLNFSVGSTLTGASGPCATPTTNPWCPGATYYILPRGTQPYAKSERP